ncbi:lysozyme inhibitor LprI family protein [Acinetobacter bereziniae]|uniref:lysozyme inhibitor LprI family protein n=1 Tax=Acinetobacter bereziniae TaxID=106648 RepID=UPI0021D07397|nr:lysozyme inhibitor LprI family protein [Acinetobacter bereziniae]
MICIRIKKRKRKKKYQKQWLKQRSQQCGKAQKSVSDDYKMKYYNCALKQTVNRANSLEKLTYRL